MTPSAARSHQLEADDRDAQLTRLARKERPNVRHWWGRRSEQGKHGAMCYLCYDIIATWSSRWPITEQAKVLIAAHRETHIQALLDGATTQPEE